MTLRADLHAADVEASLSVDNLEAASAHFLALAQAEPGSAVAARLTPDVLNLSYRRCYERRDAGDRNAVLAQLAQLVALGDQGYAFRLLIEALTAESQFESVAALCRDQSRYMPGVDAHFVAAAHQGAIARARLAGASPDAAKRAAARENLALIDHLSGSDLGRPDLWQARLDRNADLENYRAMIEILRRMEAAESDKRAANAQTVLNLIFYLRSARHPEVARTLDGFLDRLPDDLSTLIYWRHALASMQAKDWMPRLNARIEAIFPGFAVVRALEAMARDTERSPEVCFGRAPSGRPLLYGSLVCWGAAYVDLMERAAFRSLLAPGNLPAICAANDLVLEIMTDRASVERIAGCDALRKMADHCQIKIFVLPDAIQDLGPGLPYIVFGHAAHCTILRAQRHGADLLFLLPDVLYADGSLAYVAGLVTKERRAFFADGLNAAATPVLTALERDVSLQAALVIGPVDLLALAADHLMPRTTDHFIQPSQSRTSTYPTRAVYVTRSGLRIHSFTKSPIYVSHAAFAEIEAFSFDAPDAGFALDVLDAIRRDELAEPSSAEQFLVIELSDSEGATSPLEEIDLPGAIAKLFLHGLCTERSAWLFEKPVFYPTPRRWDEHEISEDRYRQEIEALKTLMASHPVFAELLPERRARARRRG